MSTTMSSQNPLLVALSYWLVTQPIYSTEISAYIHCYDWPGNVPTGQGPSRSSYAQCSLPYSITSCGVQTYPKNSADTQLEKVYLTSNACYANTPGTIPNQAIARCCDLTDYGSSFSVVSSTKSTDIATKPCLVNEEAIGCMIGTASNNVFYGAYAGSLIDYDQINTADIFDTANSCTAEAGSVSVYSMCYDTSTITDGFELNCISRWGPRSNETGTTTSTVSCPNDKENYFMTSCTGYSPFGDVKSYTVIYGVCTVTERVDPNAVYVIANAICCRMTKPAGTLNPSYQTDSPTIYPTLIPTDSTVDPTSFPTKYLTAEPTKHPTLAPGHPTKIPTDNPTFLAILHSTWQPTQQLIPSPNPTFNPTKDPVKDARVSDTMQTVFVAESQENAASTETKLNNTLLISLLIVSTILILVIFATIYIWKYKKKDGSQMKSPQNMNINDAIAPVSLVDVKHNPGNDNIVNEANQLSKVVAMVDHKQEQHIQKKEEKEDSEGMTVCVQSVDEMRLRRATNQLDEGHKQEVKSDSESVTVMI